MQNKTIKFGSVFGNFQWEAEAEISETLANALLPLGALQVAQRSPSTAAEKAMAGYEKRPNGFKRTTIPFNEGNADTLRKHLEAMKFEVDDTEFNLECVVNVKQYIPTEKESLFVAERAKYVQRAANLAALAKAVGYDGEVGNGVAEDAPMPFLVAIRAWVRAQADKL